MISKTPHKHVQSHLAVSVVPEYKLLLLHLRDVVLLPEEAVVEEGHHPPHPHHVRSDLL